MTGPEDGDEPVRPYIGNVQSADGNPEKANMDGDSGMEGDKAEKLDDKDGMTGEDGMGLADGKEMDDVEVIRKPTVGRNPRTPTQKEIEDHLPLHLKYPSWCPICVAAGGTHDQHRRIDPAEREYEGTTVYMDYAF